MELCSPPCGSFLAVWPSFYEDTADYNPWPGARVGTLAVRFATNLIELGNGAVGTLIFFLCAGDRTQGLCTDLYAQTSKIFKFETVSC